MDGKSEPERYVDTRIADALFDETFSKLEEVVRQPCGCYLWDEDCPNHPVHSKGDGDEFI